MVRYFTLRKNFPDQSSSRMEIFLQNYRNPLCVKSVFSLLSVYSGIQDNKNISLREQSQIIHKKLSLLAGCFSILPLCCTPLRKYEKFYKDHRFTSLFLSHSFCTRKAGYLYNSNKHFGIHRINFSMYATPGDISSKTNTCSHF